MMTQCIGQALVFVKQIYILVNSHTQRNVLDSSGHRPRHLRFAQC